MSVNLMSAIFETEFFDLKDEKGNTTKASTAKLVLLAMADHANDEGEGAYPSIERLSRKTALSEQTIRNTFDALRYNGIISLAGRSKYGTNNHTINTTCFPKAIGKEVTRLTLYPLDPQMSTELPSNEYHSLTYSLDPNQLTVVESSGKKTDETKGKYKVQGYEWAMVADRPVEESDLQDPKEREALQAFERDMQLPASWEWYPAKATKEREWKALREFVVKTYRADPKAFEKYNTWRNQPYVKGAKSNTQIKDYPADFEVSWSDYLRANPPAAPVRDLPPVQPDDDEANYIPNPMRKP